MKPVQIMMDLDLLAQLDATADVQQEGRSAVLRRAVAEYLERQRRAAIRDEYRRAYAGAAGLGSEYSAWEEQGVWPDE
jgi:predicted transcriptional regulator